MVDFNNETTIGTAPKDVTKIIVLEYWKYAIDSYTHHKKKEEMGVNSLHTFRSALINLWCAIYGAYNRDKPKISAEIIEKDIYDCKEERLKELYLNILDWLDQKKLTRFDTYTELSRNPIIRNKQKGY